MPPKTSALRQPVAARATLAPGVDLELIHARAREIASRVPADERQAFAQAFAATAIRAYWYGAFGEAMGGPAALPAGSGASLDDWAAAQARRQGESLACAPRALAAYALGITYATLIPEETRARQGVYYTPPPIAARLLEMVEREGTRWEQVRVLDPAAGGGAFLAPVAARIVEALRALGVDPERVLERVERNVRGIEIDPFAAWMSHVFLEAEVWEHCLAARRRLRSPICTGDALVLCDDAADPFDLVVGNPPYGRTTLDSVTRKRFARSIYGHANLYGIFMDLAVRMTRPGGRVGLVTPASFLGGRYFKELRRTLAREAPPLALDFVADRGGVFDQVLQETVLVVLGRGGDGGRVDVCVTQPSSAASEVRTMRLGRVPLAGANEAPWIVPRRRADTTLLAYAARMPHRLRDHGLEVTTGPLVWNRHKDQLEAFPGHGRFPLIWAESILPNGAFSFRARRRNHLPYFGIREGQSHLLLNEEAVLVQRTTAKEQARRLTAAVVPAAFVAEHGGVVVENHVNVLRPSRPAGSAPLRAVAALLNSEPADRIFRCISGSVAVSAYELDAIPLPAPRQVWELDDLLARGADAETVDAFVWSAYGAAAETLP